MKPNQEERLAKCLIKLAWPDIDISEYRMHKISDGRREVKFIMYRSGIGIYSLAISTEKFVAINKRGRYATVYISKNDEHKILIWRSPKLKRSTDALITIMGNIAGDDSCRGHILPVWRHDRPY